jgi:hypothetical protein
MRVRLADHRVLLTLLLVLQSEGPAECEEFN